MRKQIFLVSAIATVAVCLFFAAAGFIRAANSPDIALTGQVSSTEEGPMEGVLVSAKTDGSTVTITVISDQQGRYRFPAAKLAPGEYSISIRAIGYELEGGGAAKIIADKTANADLKLKKTQDLAAQLTSAEWIASVPGTTQQKNIFLNCMGCHTVERIMRSKYDTAGFIQALPRMANYANMSTPLHPQPRLADRSAATSVEAFKRQAEYLSTSHKGHHHRVRPAAADGRTARCNRRSARDGLVFQFRRAVPGKAQPQDRQGHGILRASA